MPELPTPMLLEPDLLLLPAGTLDVRPVGAAAAIGHPSSALAKYVSSRWSRRLAVPRLWFGHYGEQMVCEVALSTAPASSSTGSALWRIATLYALAADQLQARMLSNGKSCPLIAGGFALSVDLLCQSVD